VVAVAIVFSMARFSEAFLILRARDVGLAVSLAPAVLILMNVVYSAVAAPAGSLADRVDRRRLLVIGLVVLVLADLALSFLPSIAGVALGIALWGLHMGLTQGLFAALVADAAPARLRGTAFGVFNLAQGLTLLVASPLAGLLWTAYGAGATFLTGAGFCIVALAGLLIAVRRRPAAD
jgi:MFS family permease